MNVPELKKLYKQIQNKTVKMPDGTSEKFSFTEEKFLTKMSTKEQRKSFWQKYMEPLKKIGFKSWTYDGFEKQFGTSTTSVGNGENIQKLIAIDDRIKETTDPNQGIRNHETQRGVTRVKIFFNNGRYISREGTVNNKNGEIRGVWYFRGNDNYQVKYGDAGVTMVYDFKSGKATQVADTPPVTTQTTTGVNPTLQKLMKIDDTIKKTKSPDQVVKRTGQNNGNIWIFWSDGNYRLRYSSINNKEDEFTGRWKFIGDNDYQINTNDGDEYLKSRGTWRNNETSSSSRSSGTTWRDVTFTLADVAAGKAVLKRGDKGPAVEELQKLMIQMNLSKVSKSGQPDGKFGKLTELAIKQFQGEMAHGEQDGKVGKKTLNRMYYVYNYDPDKEVDDEQPQTSTGDDSPEFLQSQLDTQSAGGVNPTTSQAAPSDTTSQPKQKLVLTPKVIQEDIKKIVSENLKSLLK